jgi:hypothetical protein
MARVMTTGLDQLPSPPQAFVPGGCKKEYAIICDWCGTRGHFTIYSNTIRDEQWCEQALRQTMRQSYWEPGDNADYCPECKLGAQ